MNPTLKRTKSFKPVFLYKDNDWIKLKIDQLNETAESCNLAIDEVQKLFKRKLTNEERQNIPLKKWEYVADLLKKDSNFPNAEVDTLISLLGIDPKPAKEAIEKAPTNIQDLTFDKSNYVVSKEVIQKTEEIGTYYTKNQDQNNALECFKTISEALNNGIDNGVIFSPDSWQERFRGKLSVTKTVKGNWGFKPNFDYIRRTYRNKNQ